MAAEFGLDELGEEEFFCKNFLLMFTALNFFGWGAERPVELVEPDATAVIIVGRVVESDGVSGTEGSCATFSTASMGASDAFSGMTVVDVRSTLTSSNTAAPLSSLPVKSDSPGVSASIFAIHAS